MRLLTEFYTSRDQVRIALVTYGCAAVVLDVLLMASCTSVCLIRPANLLLIPTYNTAALKTPVTIYLNAAV